MVRVKRETLFHKSHNGKSGERNFVPPKKRLQFENNFHAHHSHLIEQ